MDQFTESWWVAQQKDYSRERSIWTWKVCRHSCLEVQCFGAVHQTKSTGSAVPSPVYLGICFISYWEMHIQSPHIMADISSFLSILPFLLNILCA